MKRLMAAALAISSLFISSPSYAYPGEIQIFGSGGDRVMRFYNVSGSNINCGVTNAWGNWATTGTIWPGYYKDIHIGNAPGSWNCWFQ